MNERKSYAGIDYFRLIAAFLIVAIHTSPLSSFSGTSDFLLTHILARVAVPFFLMTSGFFLITRYQQNQETLKRFLKKTGILYAFSILIYIPLNLYNKYFKMDYLLPNLLKDIFFDGTIYHLWYLPASMLGGIIAWFLVKKSGFKKALAVTSFLYIIGLFGDSYYGFSKQILLLKEMYNGLFEIFDYTRNGLFFAPVFFVLGGMIADKPARLSLKNSLIGFCVSLLLMFGEGILLHEFGAQRHDSMYIMLLPCMYFLFNSLTFWKGKRGKSLRTCALVIYIIHPMMIVVIRLFAKLFHVEKLFVENSLVHFLSVSLFSFVFAALLTLAFDNIHNRYVKPSVEEKNRAWLEVDLNHLAHNVKTLTEAMPKGCDLMAVVKANAYGHGDFAIATHLNRLGVKAFAVATIDEGIKLRRYGIVGEILILGFTPSARAKELHNYQLIQTLIDDDYAHSLNKQGYKIKAHMKIDTGMHRLGFDADDTETMLNAFALKSIDICGIFTHLCVSDSLAAEDIRFTEQQIQRFYRALEHLTASGIQIPQTHIQSSYGFLNYPELKCNYVRLGVALYGVLSSPHDQTKLQLDLRPVLSLKSQVILLRNVKSGDSVGYGQAFVAKRDSQIAILPIGYADGLPRNLSCENGEILIHGQKAPIIGRICMDQLAVDVTDMDNLSVGDVATLIGKDTNEELSAAVVANCSNSISNELLSRMGTRLKIIEKYER